MSEHATPVIDSQVHCYERDRPERPWVGTLVGPDEVSGDDMVAAMDRVDVDGALLVSPWAMYRYDPSYALEVGARHPSRFGLIKPFDPESAGVAEEMSEWARQPGVVGARLMMGAPAPRIAAADGIDRVFTAGARLGLPVNVLCWGNLAAFAEAAERNPNTQLVIDHLGLRQPFAPPPPDAPFGDLSVATRVFCRFRVRHARQCKAWSAGNIGHIGKDHNAAVARMAISRRARPTGPVAVLRPLAMRPAFPAGNAPCHRPRGTR